MVYARRVWRSRELLKLHFSCHHSPSSSLNSRADCVQGQNCIDGLGRIAFDLILLNVALARRGSTWQCWHCGVEINLCLPDRSQSSRSVHASHWLEQIIDRRQKQRNSHGLEYLHVLPCVPDAQNSTPDADYPASEKSHSQLAFIAAVRR